MKIILIILAIGIGYSASSIVGIDKAIVNLKPLEGYKYEPSYWATTTPVKGTELIIEKCTQQSNGGLIVWIEEDKCYVMYVGSTSPMEIIIK